MGRSTSGDPSNGKRLFMAAAKAGSPSCGSCHTLADAGAKGTIGPDLDAAFGSVRRKDNGGFDDSTIRDVVRGQIAYAEPPMPQNLVEGKGADDVAAYVAKCAGVPACGVQASGGGAATAASTAATTTQATATTGEQGGGGDQVAAGKKVFATAGCVACHTLKDAGATGNVGPNLDQAKPAKSLVIDRVTHGKGAMPPFKGQLTDAQIQAVATYVSSVAGK